MNEWDEVVNNLEDAEKVREESLAKEKEAAKQRELLKKEALQKINKELQEIGVSFDDIAKIASEYDIDFSWCGPTGRNYHFCPPPKGSSFSWESSEYGWTDSDC